MNHISRLSDPVSWQQMLDFTQLYVFYDVWGSICWCIETQMFHLFERNIRVANKGVKSKDEKIILLKSLPLFVGLSSFSASMSMIRY